MQWVKKYGDIDSVQHLFLMSTPGTITASSATPCSSAVQGIGLRAIPIAPRTVVWRPHLHRRAGTDVIEGSCNYTFTASSAPSHWRGTIDASALHKLCLIQLRESNQQEGGMGIAT